MYTHATFDGFILELGAEKVVPRGKDDGLTIAAKSHKLKEHLIAHHTARTPSGEFMSDAVVRKAASLSYIHQHDEFVRALATDAFAVTEDGKLRRMLPIIADIPTANDDVHALLEELGLAVTKQHLDHAIDLHSSGKWEPANGELRKVLENIFDEAAAKLEPNRASVTDKGHSRRQLLAELDPPFLIEDLGEWSNDGKNLVNGIFKRLHPGAHAGMSEGEDCTFRLHLVLVVSRLFLRRLKSRLAPN
jgi:hypothetical protein